MIASGLMPRSPVWLRKIPSTVSGSQGSRRGFAPAVRFAFPLGARMYITLRARPCQELFQKVFPAVPRAAGRPAFRASALRGGEFGIIRAPGAPGAGNPPAHRMPTTPARRSGGDGGREGGVGLALRPVPHAGRPRGPGARGAEPSGAADSTTRIQLPIYWQEDRPASGPARLPRGPSRQPPLVDLLYVRSFPLISI